MRRFVLVMLPIQLHHQARLNTQKVHNVSTHRHLTPELAPRVTMTAPRDPLDRFFAATLRLSHLRTLAALARLGQVRRVAEAFCVTQSAISKQLAEIEAGLGQAVVQREGNALAFTAIGACLAQRAQEVLHQLDRTRDDITLLRDGLGGRVVLGSVTAANAMLVPEALGLLRQRAPQLRVALEEDTADRLLPGVVDGRLDMAVVRMWQPLAHDGLAQRVLMDDPMVIVTGARHPLARRRRLVWADTMAFPWIVPRAGSPAHGALEALLAGHGLSVPPGAVESISLALNLALLTHQPFIGLLPRGFAQQCVAEGRMVVLPLDTANLLAEIRAFWREDAAHPAREVLLDCLTQAAAGQSGR